MLRQLTVVGVVAFIFSSAQYGSTMSQTLHDVNSTAGSANSRSLTVLTKDGTLHTISVHSFSDSLILGKGTSEKGGISREFSGSLRLSDVDYAYAPREWTSGKVLLTAAGVIAFAGAAAYALSDKDNDLTVEQEISCVGCSSGSGSCPFVYTYDGDKYLLESETFAGAVFKGAERASYDVLRHLEPVDGKYIMKLSNERNETQYVNELKLLAVDAPQGLEVIPDRAGGFHTIGAPVPPSRCSELNGDDALAAVEKKDGVLWQSDLPSKDLTRDDHLRDGLILEFTKPAGATAGKLVVNGVNTSLGEYAFELLFKLKGENLARWYQELENDPNERQKMFEWMGREGMLHVSVWLDDEWVEQTTLPDVGPQVAKDQLAVLDLSRSGERIVKIKLQCTVDLWRIDQVYMDYSPDASTTVEELTPATAVDDLGHDVSRELRSDDDLYYGNIGGQFVNLTFDSVPVSGATARTYILKTKGHYYLWSDFEGEDREEVLEAVLAQPLLGAKLSMPLWKQIKPRN